MTAEQLALEAAVLANPNDEAPRLVYADWLDEHGDDYVAAELRSREGQTRVWMAWLWRTSKKTPTLTVYDYILSRKLRMAKGEAEERRVGGCCCERTRHAGCQDSGGAG